MRHLIICALFLGACAPITTTIDLEAVEKQQIDVSKFYKELEAGRFAKAKKIADQSKMDRQLVWETVEQAMWRIAQYPSKVKSTKKLARLFQLPRERELRFAQNFFNQAIVNRYCENALNIATSFNLEPKRIDEALACLVGNSLFHDYSDALKIACTVHGTPKFLEGLVDTWVRDFVEARTNLRVHQSVRDMALICPFKGKHFLSLVAVGMADKKPDFVLAMIQMAKSNGFPLRYDVLYSQLYEMVMDLPYDLYNLGVANLVLREGGFEKTLADYDRFIALAVSWFQCDIALGVAVEYRLPNDKIRSVFFHPRCLSADLKEFDFDVVRPDQAGWLFETSLQAGRFLFARNLAGRFSMGQKAIERVIFEAWNVKDLDTLMKLDPPPNIGKRDHQERLLEKIMNGYGELFVAKYASAQAVETQTREYIDWYGWVERAYLRALHRGAYDVAANIAGQHMPKRWSVWAIQLAFDQAMKNNDPDSAKLVAKNWSLGQEALHRAVLLGWKKVQAEDRKRALELRRHKKRGCKSVDPWSVERCR